MTHPLWNDEYWLLLLQLYLKKPVGMKPFYSRQLVDLSLETHVPPRYLYNQMFRLRHSDSPLLHLLWETYGKQPKKLADDVKKLKRMKGFGKSEKFYDGVEIKETFEKDFRPLPQNKQLKPVMLIMILDLYFRLTPITMSPETPEVRQLAKLMHITPQLVADVMDVFQFCDPYLNRDDMIINPLLLPCQEIWNRYGNDNPETLSALAAQLRDYFK
ncbi:hypothetical protein [Prevotella lacticifex]|uniref:Uncharacterized protein n=1 Tax=Prevotella lacticifex TaxID=2854755 RepID=A0A9R1CCF3_9BACT|nr:hypothetical protein [Prevotella lacticifex]GJG36360.1 hypothetical protein PRLR5003_15170 [Prevotella lacticifex]GJG38219.1 hypothetical protein PRLR5019_01900 [Prevotella lacticifex]GJG43098.1 hypothetical protein PRLR5025_18840 [Prevotella lacticifex]GJG44576.1 hypothetical protein PRLR5027_01710 [Prevotella lacticifex]GJG49449.1 hypothetical protein PRLR5052_18620 [Prevotella lacticifex]